MFYILGFLLGMFLYNFLHRCNVSRETFAGLIFILSLPVLVIVLVIYQFAAFCIMIALVAGLISASPLKSFVVSIRARLWRRKMKNSVVLDKLGSGQPRECAIVDQDHVQLIDNNLIDTQTGELLF